MQIRSSNATLHNALTNPRAHHDDNHAAALASRRGSPPIVMGAQATNLDLPTPITHTQIPTLAMLSHEPHAEHTERSVATPINQRSSPIGNHTPTPTEHSIVNERRISSPMSKN